jgi:hypothetical protein
MGSSPAVSLDLTSRSVFDEVQKISRNLKIGSVQPWSKASSIESKK